MAAYSTVPLRSASGLDLPVCELMHTDYVAIDSGAPLASAAALMASRRVHAVLAVDADGHPLGWVTARGMLHNAPRDWRGATVADAITEPVGVIAPDAPLRAALDAFLASGSSHVVVAESPASKPRGVLADSDLLGVVARGLA
jgi:CBS domain-containing protein